MICVSSDNSIDRRSWNERLGKCDFTLAFILLLDHQSSFKDQNRVDNDSKHLPNPTSFIGPVRSFISRIVWGRSDDVSSSFSTHSTMLALILLKHGQFDAVEVWILTSFHHYRQFYNINKHIKSSYIWFFFCFWSIFLLWWTKIYWRRKHLVVFRA